MVVWERPSRRPRLGIALLAFLALWATAAPSSAAAAEAEPAFCARETLHDYLSPLQRLPKLRELPYRRRAEPLFRGVNIGASGPSLAVSGGSAGYQLQWDSNPKWDITVTLARVNWSGKVVQWLGRRRLRLGDLGQALITEPHFALPEDKPAVYRTTLLIRSSSGRKLGEFGNYYRVIRHTVHTRLATSAATYRPGDTLFARVENPGAAFILFGEEFEIEKFEGRAWVLPPEAIPMSLYEVAPGTTSNHCTVYPIPASTPPGRYRLSEEAVISWPTQHRQIRPILHAEFEVTP